IDTGKALAASSAVSGNTAVATADVANGKISITSVSAGSAVITVSDSSTPPHTATIAVTVAAVCARPGAEWAIENIHFFSNI
ncbi:MAG: hypothetical protein LBS57_03340, partial [Treponema sp.]|nr:hypothetical protein [Treponema sp.]